MNLNKCLLAGRLTRDPELRFSTKGSALGSFTIAINRRWKTETGEQKEDVAYLDCKVFGKAAETIAQYFRKGSQIMIEARATTEAWEDKNTKEKRSAIRFVVDQFHFVGDKAADVTPSPNPPSDTKPAALQPYKMAGAGASDDSDVPF
jgi:single-strand DNA-binding protein